MYKCPGAQEAKSTPVSKEASPGLLSSSEIPILDRLLETRTALLPGNMAAKQGLPELVSRCTDPLPAQFLLLPSLPKQLQMCPTCPQWLWQELIFLEVSGRHGRAVLEVGDGMLLLEQPWLV